MTLLTDAQLAAIAERSIDPWNWYITRSDIPALLASHAALAARLAEAEQTIVQRVATIHGLSKIIDGHEAEMEDLAQRCDKAVAGLAAAQAPIARQQTFIKDIEWLGHSFDAGQPYLHCLICQGIKGVTGHTPLCPIPTLLASPAPEADDAATTVQE